MPVSGSATAHTSAPAAEAMTGPRRSGAAASRPATTPRPRSRDDHAGQRRARPQLVGGQQRHDDDIPLIAR